MSGKKSPDPKLISEHTLTRDFLGIGIAGFALFALISIISYSPLDPSFHQFSSQENEIQNYGGLVGSYLADGLVRVFGTGAFVFPLVAFLVGWAIIRGQEFRRWPLVLFFGSIFLVTLCSLLALQFTHDLFFGKSVETGGVIGTTISNGLVQWLGVVGAYLVLTLILFVSTLAMSGVPANKPTSNDRSRFCGSVWMDTEKYSRHGHFAGADGWRIQGLVKGNDPYLEIGPQGENQIPETERAGHCFT